MTTPFQLLQDDWVLVTPLGDFPHQLGIQRLTPAGIAAMANRFNSFRARLGRLFGGVPMFEGHHDTEPERYPNGRSFAWVMKLENRPDGLWARLKWTDEGRALVTNGNYKFLSPVWNAREAGRENGRTIYIPESLLSLALTNLPNLPLPPLANERNNMTTITELLELPADASPEQIVDAVSRLKKYDLDSRQRTSTLGNKIEAGLGSPKLTEILKINDDATPEAICAAAETLANQLVTRETETTTLQNTLTTKGTELANAIQRASELQSRLITMILANAVRENRITLAEKDQWLKDLTANFDAKSAEIEALPPKLNTQSVTRELGNQKAMYDTEATRRAALTSFIDEKMANGLSYDDAWRLAKVERADIFANMARK